MNRNQQLFQTPFSGAYWRCAWDDFKNPQILIVAALLIALRVAIKSIAIPVGPYLNITVGFFVNALGAMIFGPVTAIFAAAVSDTLGCVLFPTGAYFFPFIFVEIAGSLLFALMLYRVRVTTWRVIVSRFLVMFVCNLVLNPAILILYNRLVLGGEYAFFTLPRMIKNLCLFPAEAFLLVLFLNVMIPVTSKLGLTYGGSFRMQFTKRHIVTLVVMALVAAAAVAFYGYYKAVLSQ